jgi:hypothetical protein
MKRSILSAFAFTALTLFAADSTLRYTNYVYEKDFKGIQLYQSASGFNMPVINLGSGEQLTLEFDQLKSEMDYYQYTLIHCNSNWQPSGIQRTQCLQGTGFEDLPNPTFSTGTLMQYTHYMLQFPGVQTQPKISGNYLLLIYRNYDEKDIVITRRFMVADLKGNVEMTIQQSMQIDLRATHQEIDFTFNLTQPYFVPNPYTDLKTVIMRNAEWGSVITDLPPQFITGSAFNYNYQVGNQIEGLNEHRLFDIRSYRMSTANVKQRFNVSNQKHIVLVSEQTRRFDRYFNWPDYNGRFFLYNKDIPIPGGGSVESDYCFVHFSLKSSEELKGKKVYVYGELSDWRIQADYQLFYNTESMEYEAVIPLKQAYYNYRYVVVDEKTGLEDNQYFEGSHSETENNYSILVYHKNQTMGYDELIGYGLKNSRQTK